ncbi:MAG: M28 family peptidase [Gemmatimonadaceae bacterium]|nr:M28 family peptidase [Gemmatimonadaceae bacterium]
MTKTIRRSLAFAVVFAAACGGSDDPTTLKFPTEGMVSIDTAMLMHHIRVLADDSLQGRAPGTLGEDRTINYIEAQFSGMGLKPGNPDGTYIQKVPFVGITVTNSPTMTFSGKGKSASLKWHDDFVAWTKHVSESAALKNSELVFVGYGVEAPEFGWDDFKGVDLKGKTMVVLVNDPPLADTAVFGGPRMTYYGRWTYKYEQGMKHKAAGVLIVHETKEAGYPFAVVQGKTAEQFDLVTPDKNMGRSDVEGWITVDQAKALFAMAGQDFDALKAKAASKEFAPVPLGVTASVALKNKLRTVDSRNVVAKLEGKDPELKNEYVIYNAHWDHFGIGTAINGDSIYNGASDNATGVAGLLSIAKAFAMLTPPKRSILFIAVTGEEQGLLGSQYYATNPLYPINKTVAVINLDGLNTWGKTSDLVVTGLGASDLDDYARAAAAEQGGRVLVPDAEPEKGYFYRSDHFNFAKVGVPAFYPGAGVTFVGKDSTYGLQKRNEYTANHYHKPSDDIKPEWDLSGAAQDAQLCYAVGYRVAMAAKWPEWKPGNEFKAIRDASLKGPK